MSVHLNVATVPQNTPPHSATFRTGPTWQRKTVDAKLLQTGPRALQRQAYAMATINESTAFYLGTFHGKHLIASNHHVLPDQSHCHRGNPLVFPLYKINTYCASLVGSWKAIDLAIAEVPLEKKDADQLEKVAKNFSYATPLTHQETLMTLGFGKTANRGWQLTASFSWPCMVFSPTGVYSFMADRDKTNPGPYKAWSFAHGCDVSHGDSGAPILNRTTGDIVGLVWTGSFPKHPVHQNRSYLRDLLKNPQNDGIWQVLNYGVPAQSIGGFLQEVVKNPQTGAATKATLEALLEGVAPQK